jgi:hypothetical protein
VSAYQAVSLKSMIDALPDGIFVVGDPAYIPSEHLVTSYCGAQRNNAANDTFNFYQSQVRIRIEMAFGRLVTKWRILRSPMTLNLPNTSLLLEALAVLHNYCIDSDLSDRSADTSPAAIRELIDPLEEDDPQGMGYTPVIAEDSDLMNIDGTSFLRDSIRDRISIMGYTRPSHNIERNGN